MAKKTPRTGVAYTGVGARSARKTGARKTTAKLKRLSRRTARASTKVKRRSRPAARRQLRLLCDTHLFGAAPRSADRSIDDLNLQAYVKTAAQQLLTAHPSVVFTSGRRTIKEQADAMAGNVVANRRYIEQTYAASSERDALQKWVDDNPEATTKTAISNGLQGIMNGWNDSQKRKLSLHFSGEAFDVKPVTGSAGDEIKKTTKNLPKLRKFLESEGGLTIWHAEFSP
jgi:hypothetical protein